VALALQRVESAQHVKLFIKQDTTAPHSVLSAHMMADSTKRFRGEIQSVQRTEISLMGLFALIWVAGCGGVFTGIPDLDSPDGRVFVQRCGGCHGTSYGGGHGVPDPRFRRMTEWREILPKMDRLIRERGLPPLTESEREAIFRYLGHHAKT
jgi:hypothetical protein